MKFEVVCFAKLWECLLVTVETFHVWLVNLYHLYNFLKFSSPHASFHLVGLFIQIFSNASWIDWSNFQSFSCLTFDIVWVENFSNLLHTQSWKFVIWSCMICLTFGIFDNRVESFHISVCWIYIRSQTFQSFPVHDASLRLLSYQTLSLFAIASWNFSFGWMLKLYQLNNFSKFTIPWYLLFKRLTCLS